MNSSQDRHDKPLTAREKWAGVYMLIGLVGLIAFALVHNTVGGVYSAAVVVTTLVAMGLTAIKIDVTPLA